MGPRRAPSGSLVLAESWPSASAAADLAWAGFATFAGRRDANGYDPLVPATRRRALDGMRADGTLPRALLETDPGRLELLGIRWLQVPTEALVRTAAAEGLGDELDVVLEERRPHLFALPLTRATRGADRELPRGRGPGGAGPDRGGVRRAAGQRPRDLAADPGRRRHRRVGLGPPGRAARRQAREGRRSTRASRTGGVPGAPVLERPAAAGLASSSRALRFRVWPGAPPLWLLRAGLRDARERSLDRRRSRLGLRERRGPAGAGGSHAARQPLRGAPGDRAGLGRRDAPARGRRGARRSTCSRSPTRFGVDARREAVADGGRRRRASSCPPAAAPRPPSCDRTARGSSCRPRDRGCWWWPRATTRAGPPRSTHGPLGSCA